MSAVLTVTPNPAKVGDSLVATGTGFQGTGTAEVQHIAVDATSGTFTITWNGQTTTGINFNALASDVQTALEALSNIAPGDVVVTGGPGDSGGTTPYILTWAAILGNVAQPTCGSGSLAGGGHTATPTTSSAGVDPVQDTVEVEFIHSSNATADVRYSEAAVAGAFSSAANLTYTVEEQGTVTVNARVSGAIVDTVEVEVFTA